MPTPFFTKGWSRKKTVITPRGETVTGRITRALEKAVAAWILYEQQKPREALALMRDAGRFRPWLRGKFLLSGHAFRYP